MSTWYVETNEPSLKRSVVSSKKWEYRITWAKKHERTNTNVMRKRKRKRMEGNGREVKSSTQLTVFVYSQIWKQNFNRVQALLEPRFQCLSGLLLPFWVPHYLSGYDVSSHMTISSHREIGFERSRSSRQSQTEHCLPRHEQRALPEVSSHNPACMWSKGDDRLVENWDTFAIRIIFGWQCRPS